MKTIPKPYFIVNPAAAQGEVQRVWPELAKKLRMKFRHFDFAMTEKSGDSTKLTRKALQKGHQLIVVIGGDGTLSESVNGFFDRGKKIAPKSVLGIIPFGCGNDWARNVGIPLDPFKSISHLSGNRTITCDVGKVTYRSFTKKIKSRYFLNIANVGIVGHVDYWAKKSPRFIGPKGVYMYGALRGALDYEPSTIVCKTDTKSYTDKIMNIMIANGAYFGAGMKPAPKASSNDGKFDVILVRHMGLLKFLKNFPLIYSGKHLKMSNTDFFRSKSFEVELQNRAETPPYVEADGDVLGYPPARFEILHKALEFKV